MDILEQFGIDWRLLVIQVINFLILMLVLKKLLYKPVTAMLEKRRAEVVASMKASEEMQKEKEEFSKQAAKEMANVRKKAHEVTVRADEAAANAKQQAQEDAKLQAQEIVASAKKEVAAEKEKIIDDVRSEITNIVVDTTEKVLGKEMEGSHEEFIQREVSAKK